MLHVIISGAGIAGLAAAVSLRRAGHIVDIYERSAMNNEIGAAINVPPNASRFLLAWGLDPKEWRFVTARLQTFNDPKSLKPFIINDLSAAQTADTAKLYLAHRVDLHNALKWMATRPDGPGEPVRIHLQSEVVAYDPDAPSMTLRSGEVIHGDLIIGADGVHSIACETVLQQKNKPIKPMHANFCYRFLIPTADIEADPETRFYNENCEGGTKVIPHSDGKRRVVSYMCRENTIHNFVGLFSDDEMEAGTEDWQASVDISEVLKRFSDFNPDLLKVMAKASEAKQWPLLYRSPLETWHRGYMALAGDSAHPMLPHQGQGGAQGMEDGLALGIIMSGATSKEEAKERLEIYQQVRHSRASVIQVLSNVGQDQLKEIRHEAARYMPEDRIPSNQQEVRQFNFHFDIADASIRAMRQYDPSFELPSDFFDHPVAGVPSSETLQRKTSNLGANAAKI